MNPEAIKTDIPSDKNAFEQDQKISDKLIADGFLSIQERNLIKETFASNKESLKKYIISEKNNFIESDFWNLSLSLVWSDTIAKINKNFWIKWNHFSVETFKAVIKFQKENNLTIDWIIWPNTSNSILNQPDNNQENINENFWNLKEIADYAINKVLDLYFDKIEQDWWLNLSIDSIYNDVIDILDSIQHELPENNIFKNQFDSLKNNFFIPKEVWYETIKIAQSKLIEIVEPEKPFWNTNISEVKHVIISGIWTLFDIAKNSSPEELNKIINEFSDYPQIKDIINKIPDFKIIFSELLPTIIETIDKETFINSLSDFLDNISPNIQFFIENWGKEIDPQVLKSIKLNFFSEKANFISKIINKDSVEQIINWVQKLSLIWDNELMNDLLNLSKNLTSSEKLIIIQSSLDLLKVISSEKIDETKLNQMIDNLLNQLNIFANKIWSKQILDFIKKHWFLESESKKIEIEEEQDGIIDSIVNKVWSAIDYLDEKYQDAKSVVNVCIEAFKNPEQVWKLLELVIEHKEEIQFIIEDYINWELDTENTEDLLKYMLDKDILWRVIKKMWKWFSDKISWILNINVNKLILNSRNELIDSIKIWDFIEKADTSSNLAKTSEVMAYWIWNDIYKAIISKITATDAESKFLSKDEIIEIWLKSIKNILNDPKYKSLLIWVLTESWIKLPENANDKLLEMINNILSYPRMKDIISNIITNIHKRVDNSDEIMQDLLNLAKDSNKEFIKRTIIQNQETIIDMWIDTLFEGFIYDIEWSKVLFELLEKNLNIGLNFSEENIIKSVEILKTHLDVDKLKIFLKENTDLIDSWWKIKSEDVIKLAGEFFSIIDDKNWLIQDLSESWIIKKLSQSFNSNSSENNLGLIDNTTIDVTVNSLYATLENTKEENFTKTVEVLIKEVWLEWLLKQKILGQNIADISYEFFTCIEKKDLIKILQKNKETLKNILSGKKDISDISNLSSDIFSKINVEKLQKLIDTKWLTSLEKTWVDLIDEIQKLIKENPEKMKEIFNIMEKLVDIFQSWKKIKKWSEEAKHIVSYWEKIFDLINSLILKIDDNYLDENLVIEWKSENSKKSKVEEIINWFGESFASNNFWFLLWNCVDSVNAISWKPWQLVDDYFRDNEHRDDFADSLHDFLVK